MSKEKKVLQESSVGMALMDALPVICFSAAIYLLGTIFPSILFRIGAVLVIAAGAGKVLWKLILAIKKKSIFILNAQLRYLMPAGFLLIVISLIVDRKYIDLYAAWDQVTTFPVWIFFLWAVVGMCLMGVCGGILDPSKPSSNWIEQSINLSAQLALLIGVVLCSFETGSYQPAFSGSEKLTAKVQEIRTTKGEENAIVYTGAEGVAISVIDEGLFFDGPGEDRAMIFYPGGGVEYTAYTELMFEYAKAGMDCFLLDMPMNLAILDTDMAEKIRRNADWSYEKWYMGGHSHGGAMAASYMERYHSDYSGLILLAAYSAGAIEIPPEEEPFHVISLYGSNDRVLSLKRVEAARAKMPEHYTETVIEGGNHSGFGSYGSQSGDGEAEIDPAEQKRCTVELCMQIIEG